MPFIEIITDSKSQAQLNKVITKSVRSPDKPTMNYELIAAHEIGHVLAE